MIDLHSHILPAIDDGPSDLPASLEMLRAAAGSGTTDIVATPHADLTYPYDELAVRKAFEELKASAPDTPTLHLGCELHITYDNVVECLRRPLKYSIASGRYLLVELPQFMSAPAMTEVWDRMRSAGLTPVLAHPERSAFLQSRPETLQRWIDHGCLLQVTAASFGGRFGRRAADAANRLLDAGLIHFIGSDAHDCESRGPELATAFDYVAGRSGREYAEALFCENPRAVLRNEPLPNRVVRNASLMKRLFAGRA